MGNKESILDLVKTYFSLDRDSYNFFEKRLYEPKIDEVYKPLIGDDLRGRFPLREEELERFDKGWQIFKRNFKVFTRDEKITYSEFRNNKKLVNKNYIKLKKLLKDYYEKNTTDELVLEHDLRSINHLSHSDDFEDFVDHFIDNVYHDIGKVKLPKKGIEVVLSLNFEDWFFCSTSESWSSCLNLGSEYVYWAGLPGLVGDRNRAMLYITDNQKKDPFKDFSIDSEDTTKLDKMLSRSWVLLDDENDMNIVNFYPSEYFDIDKINDITGCNFINHRWNRFHSKYRLEHLYFENGRSAFIYQDSTRTAGNGHLVGGGKGLFHVSKNNPSLVDSEDVFLQIESGLSHLIEVRQDLTEHERTLISCDQCGRTVEDEDDIYYVDGEQLCNNCFDENYFICSECGDIHRLDESHEIHYDLVCNDCFERNYSVCEHCEKIVDNDEVHAAKIDGQVQYICIDCVEELELEICEECSIFHKKEDITYDEYEQGYCNKCMKRFIERKQLPLIEVA